jgi:holo-[acyl-carrier protein] synthase
VIVGVGVDLASVERLEAAFTAHGDRFERRIFTPEESAYCRAQRRPGIPFAARFAAKEAFAKALGTGVGAGMRWLDVSVAHEASGLPVLAIEGAARRAAEARGAVRAHVSLSHDAGYAVAVVVLESA